jgi:4-amino-4-deoxy-L-arabinose transferase-like glycosyltransferase
LTSRLRWLRARTGGLLAELEEPSLLSPPPNRGAGASKARRAIWLEGAALTICLILAGVLRFYRLDSLPPGVDLDEARNGVEVLDVLAGNHPLFFTRYDPREPAFIYSLSLTVRAFGHTAFAMHLTSALWSMAAVALTYVVARQWFGRAVGLLSAAGVAGSLWALTMSRWAERDVTLPPVLLLCLFFLWRGFQRRSTASFVLAGVFGSLCLYAYVAARILPVVILVIVLGQWLLARESLARCWKQALAGALAALVTAAPLVIYFVRNPKAFFGRIELISSLSPSIPGLAPDPAWKTALQTLGMFFLHGDVNWRDNLPGRPVFVWWLAIPFCAGLLWTLRHAFSTAKDVRLHLGDVPPDPEPRLYPCFWLLTWGLALLMPALVARPAPQFDRTIGSLPAAYILLAIGLAASAAWLQRRGLRRIGWIGAAALTVLLGIDTFRAYFGLYASADPPLHVFEYGQVVDAAVLNALQPPPERTVIFLGDASGTPIRYLAPRYASALWMEDFSQLVPLPAAPGDATYVFAAPSLPGSDRRSILERYFPDARVVGRATFPNTEQAARVYDISPAQVSEFQGAERRLNAQFGERAVLESVSAGSPLLTVRPGEVVKLGLTWRVLAGNHDNFDAFVHIVDAQGKMVAQDDRQGLPALGWQAGQRFLSAHFFSLPQDAPPGRYHVLAGLDHLTSDVQPARSLGEYGPQVEVLTLTVSPPR